MLRFVRARSGSNTQDKSGVLCLVKYGEFFERYSELLPCAYESLGGVRSLTSAAWEPIYEWRVNKRAREDPTILPAHAKPLYAILDSSLLREDFGFFSDAYQSFILSNIQGLREAGLPLEACGRWSSVFLILRKFIADARDVFRELAPQSHTMPNGGNFDAAPYMSAYTGFYSSNSVFDSLIVKTIGDWDKAHLVAIEDQNFEDFESEIRYVDIYDAVSYLKSVGFFKPKGFAYYEKRFDEKTVELARDFMPTM